MKSKIFYIIFFGILFVGCLNDEENLVNETQMLQLNGLILREAEERGDFINSSRTALFPNFVTARQLHTNLNGYKIIDVRNSFEYANGHIQNSVNVTNTELFEYVRTQTSLLNKFVIVSNSGQAASYYTALFRIHGFENVYTLLFGMASWNKDFTNEIMDYIEEIDTLGTDNNINNPVINYNLPDINSSSGSSPAEIFTNRIISLFNEGFDEEPLEVNPEYFHSSINTINFPELFENFEEYFVICYGTSSLYVQPRGWMAHPYGAVNYYPFAPNSDINSGNKLQKIPNNRKIGIYSYSGHLSAMLTAYLRLLGYDAKSILFGGISRRYDILKLDTLSASSIYIYRGAENFEYEQ